jgi:hypothetical protein
MQAGNLLGGETLNGSLSDLGFQEGNSDLL